MQVIIQVTYCVVGLELKHVLFKVLRVRFWVEDQKHPKRMPWEPHVAFRTGKTTQRKRQPKQAYVYVDMDVGVDVHADVDMDANVDVGVDVQCECGCR